MFLRSSRWGCMEFYEVSNEFQWVSKEFQESPGDFQGVSRDLQGVLGGLQGVLVIFKGGSDYMMEILNYAYLLTY